jgi:hypothetical protein
MSVHQSAFHGEEDSTMSMTYDQLMRMQSSGRIFQERADSVLQPWDMRAPAPVLGQDIDTYRRDLDVKLKKLLPNNHELRKVQYQGLSNSALDALEPQLYAAVRQAAHNPSTVPPGEFRRVVEVGTDGLKTVSFIGQRSFIHDFGRPGRRVVSFLNQYDAAGRTLR